MLSIGAIILVVSMLTQFIFVGHETPKHEPSKHEIDARWENVA